MSSNSPFTTASGHNRSFNDHNPSSQQDSFAPLRQSTFASGAMNNANGSRVGAGSPSYDNVNKLYTRRAREIQAEEGVVTPPPWRLSSASSQSSLREQSALHEGSTADFPSSIGAAPSLRRARAGTLPSRFISNHSPPPPPPPTSSLLLSNNTNRISPVPSPFAPMSTQQPIERKEIAPPVSSSSVTESSVTSRLRSGSLGLPPRTNYAGNNNGFASSVLWSSTQRNTSSNVPTSPAHSSFSREDENSPMRTLDYLGLADTPQPSKATLVSSQGMDPVDGQRAAAMQPFMSDLVGFQRINRLRSYSVNAKEQYDDEEDDEVPYGLTSNSSLNPMHSQLSGFLTTINRPRARTVGVPEAPALNRMKTYAATPSRLADSSISASDLGQDYFVAEMNNLQINPTNGIMRSSSGEGGLQSIEEASTFEGPTRSLWLGNIPPSTTVSTLVQIFQQYGPVESARVLTHKSCGFVNFIRLESAIQSRSVLHGKEIFPGAGAVRIGFAKVLSEPGNGSSNGANRSVEDLNAGAQDSGSLNGRRSADESTKPPVEVFVPELPIIKDEILKIVDEFGTDDDAKAKIAGCIDQAIKYQAYEAEIPAVPDPSHGRVHDAPKLRDIRKRIDNNACSKQDIEDIATAMLDEVAELSSDYLGNTVVQKLFEYCSEDVKETMLQRVAPHLAEIGIHKNGTWAGQKIIDVARTPSQMALIVEHLRKYTVALFHDQYGNYVLQGCLRFGTPWNDFVFEAMMARMWEIAQGRFGARAMRACLESHHASKEQTKMLAACIALHSVQLASNANGALLLTWFLDTCNFPRRRTVLAPRLVPHLVHLCTHKVAYLTVLKVINQRGEPEAREIILKALFYSPNDQVLEDILKDHSCGATLIFKILTTPFFEDPMRKEVQETIRNVLTRLKAQPGQGYKRLMDEVGMSTRNTGSQSSHSQREHSRDNGVSNNERIRAPTGPAAGNQSHLGQNNQNYNNYYGGVPGYSQVQAGAGIPRMDPSGGMPGFGHMGMMGADAMAALQLQQYQAAALLAAGQMQGAGLYPQMAPLGYPQGPSVPQDRVFQNQGGNANVPNGPQGVQQPALGPNPFLAGLQQPFNVNPLLAQQMLGGYPYGQMPMYPPQGAGGLPPQVQQMPQGQQQQQGNQQGNPRRGGRR